MHSIAQPNRDIYLVNLHTTEKLQQNITTWIQYMFMYTQDSYVCIDAAAAAAATASALWLYGFALKNNNNQRYVTHSGSWFHWNRWKVQRAKSEFNETKLKYTITHIVKSTYRYGRICRINEYCIPIWKYVHTQRQLWAELSEWW